MTTALINTRAQLGLDSPAVTVEVHLPSGLPGFTCTGIRGQDPRDRVKSAIQNSAFDFPAGRIVVNLAPADLQKSGPRYDLAIAAGILVASEQLPEGVLRRYELLGELSLFGDVRAVSGALSAARACSESGRVLLCPTANNNEFAEATAPPATPAASPESGRPNTTKDPKKDTKPVRLIQHLNDLVTPARLPVPTQGGCKPASATRPTDPLGDIRGQLRAKRALTIAAAGGHHMLMTGPPGAGKTMLAERLGQLLPPLTPQAAREVAEIHSLSGQPIPQGQRAPFRAPHHSASMVALTGGGSPPTPGEITHAHRGVLFLDELPEFRRDAIDALREPLESGHIRLARRGYALTYPARFQLIAAMNPCPTGLVCTPATCRCAPEQATRYRNRISAPVRDRIDLHVEVQSVPLQTLLDGTRCPPTTTHYLQQIAQARALQRLRGAGLNAELGPTATDRLCFCSNNVKSLLKKAAETLALSARAYYRTLRVARTITDLNWAETHLEAEDEGALKEGLAAPVSEAAIAEALGFRAVERGD